MMTSALRLLSWLFVSLHLLLWLPTACNGEVGPDQDCTLEARFYEAEYGCQCLTTSLDNGCNDGPETLRIIRCTPLSTLDSFPVSTVVNRNVSCIILYNGGFQTLTKDHLVNFPDLRGLYLRDARGLRSVSEDLFEDTKRLEYLTITESRIRKLPRLTGMTCLQRINVTNNEIEEIKAGEFNGSTQIHSIYAGGNRIREIRGEVFTNLCLLGSLHLHNNPIRFVDNTALENTAIKELDLSHTDIDRVPVTDTLRSWLVKLFLEGTKRLIEFDPYAPPPNAPYHHTFPYLTEVTFNYHAHCCRMRNHTFLEDPVVQNARLQQRSLFSNNNPGFIKPAKPVLLDHIRQVRQVDDATPSPLLRCVNVTSMECVDAVDNVTTLTAEQFCNSTNICYSCLSDICPRRSCDPNATNVTSSDVGGSSDIVCVSVTPQPAPTQTVVSSLFTQVNKTVCMPSPTPAATEPPSICDNPTLDFVCNYHNIDAYCNECYPSSSVTCTQCASDSNLCQHLPACPGFALVCECHNSGGFRFERDLTASEQFLDKIQPHSLKKRDTMMSSSGDDQICTVSEIEAVCVTTVTIPLATPTMTPPTSTDALMPSVEEYNETEWFFPDPNNTDFRCRERIDNETTEEPIPDNSMTGSGVNSPLCNQLDCGNPLPFSEAVVSPDVTSCHPIPNELNPCDDLLEDNHALRVFIWIVVFLALVGNALVISVFLGYSVFLRRARQDLFVSHFFYFNLAIADSLMGVYLITIAIEDLVTLNNFSAYDIRWRIGHGCGFAGFCAILSTMVSVYVLVVISVERAYTIVRVMYRKKITKTVAMVIMAVGWIFGVIVAMLPLVGVSDYGFVAICLPFDVSTPINQGYVVFLLLVTGLAFVIVAVSYIIIFYQVFCSRKKHVQRHSSKAWKQEVKAAFRMSLLVATNFVCWLPIASVGIGSAFGYNLNVDLTFAKWTMVFIFPINACLNPFLYSFTTKVFRDNFVILVSKCGICKSKAREVRNARIGITPSITSRDSSSQIPGPRKRGTIIERLRLLSLSAQGSSADLSERRDSGSLIDNDKFLNQKRRSSEFSSASADILLANASRRSSTFSGSSLEDNMTFSNPGYRANSPISRTSTEVTVVIEPAKIVQSTRPKVSATSLGVVPEEGEMSSLSEDTLKMNNGYIDGDTSSSPVVLRRNGEAFTQHQIDASKVCETKDNKRDSGNSSESPSVNEEYDAETTTSGTNNSNTTPPPPPSTMTVVPTAVDSNEVECTMIDEVDGTTPNREVQSEEIEFD